MKRNIIGVLFAAGVGLAVASPAEAQGPITDQSAEKGQLAALAGNNHPESDPVWVLPAALFIVGLAAGYGLRSFVSRRRHDRELRLGHGRLTSDGQLKAHNSNLWIVGDLPSPQRPTAAPPGQSS